MLAARSSAFVSDDLLGKMIEANNSLFCFSDPSTNISIPEFARALWFSESFALNLVYGFFHLFSFFAFLRVKLCFPPLLYSLKSVPHSHENASTFSYTLYTPSYNQGISPHIIPLCIRIHNLLIRLVAGWYRPDFLHQRVPNV
jgi:hypothetical protein